MERHTAKVTFDDGNWLITTINGTEDEIRQYYLTNWFNIGPVEDDMHRAVAVEFLSPPAYSEH